MQEFYEHPDQIRRPFEYDKPKPLASISPIDRETIESSSAEAFKLPQLPIDQATVAIHGAIRAADALEHRPQT